MSEVVNKTRLILWEKALSLVRGLGRIHLGQDCFFLPRNLEVGLCIAIMLQTPTVGLIWYAVNEL